MDAIVSFKSTQDAIRGERLLLDEGETVRVMPLPGGIAAGCGICLRVPHERRERAKAVLEKGGIFPQGMHLLVDGRYMPFPVPLFTRALGLRPGDAAAIIGCGGKTSLLHRLATENRHLPVLLSTTTRIFPPPDDIVDRRLSETDEPGEGVNLLCDDCGEKMCGVPPELMERRRPTDGLTLVEADGSRGLPLKGWAEHEPVVPDFVSVTVGVCTLWPVGLPFSPEVVHRPEIFRELVRIDMGETIHIDHIVLMIGEMFRKAVGRRALFVNQVESPEAERDVRILAAGFPGLRVVAGSLHRGSATVLTEEG